jgi:hypothetical protein
MGMSQRIHIVSAAILALALGGCGEARKAIGWDKNPPDEFRVVTRAPLSVPPEFGLRPPTPGAPRPQEGTTTDQARNAVTGNRTATAGRTPPAVSRQSPGENALLARAGADRADPAIRTTVDREAAALSDADRSFTDKLVFWRPSEPPGTIVDAEREAKRLRENQALGRATTEGDTPIIRRRQRGLFEGLF